MLGYGCRKDGEVLIKAFGVLYTGKAKSDADADRRGYRYDNAGRRRLSFGESGGAVVCRLGRLDGKASRGSSQCTPGATPARLVPIDDG